MILYCLKWFKKILKNHPNAPGLTRSPGLVFIEKSGGASRCRGCYQWGLPRLVLFGPVKPLLSPSRWGWGRCPPSSRCWTASCRYGPRPPGIDFIYVHALPTFCCNQILFGCTWHLIWLAGITLSEIYNAWMLGYLILLNIWNTFRNNRIHKGLMV